MKTNYLTTSFLALLSVNAFANPVVIKSVVDSSVLYVKDQDRFRLRPVKIDLEKFEVSENNITSRVSIQTPAFVKIVPNDFIDENEYLLYAKKIVSMIGRTDKEWDKYSGHKEYHHFCLSSEFGARKGDALDLDCKTSTSPLCTPTKENIIACLEERSLTILPYYRFKTQNIETLPLGYGIGADRDSWWGHNLGKNGPEAKLVVPVENTSCRPFYANSKDTGIRADINQGLGCSLAKQFEQISNALRTSTGSTGSIYELSPSKNSPLGLVRLRQKLADNMQVIAPWNLTLDAFVGQAFQNINQNRTLVLQNTLSVVKIDHDQSNTLINKIQKLRSIEGAKNLFDQIQIAKTNSEILYQIHNESGLVDEEVFIDQFIMAIKGKFNSQANVEREALSFFMSANVSGLVLEEIFIKREINIK